MVTPDVDPVGGRPLGTDVVVAGGTVVVVSGGHEMAVVSVANSLPATSSAAAGGTSRRTRQIVAMNCVTVFCAIASSNTVPSRDPGILGRRSGRSRE